MGRLTIGVRVIARDDLGRFVSRIEEAAVAATRDTAERGAEIARAHAPVRTGRLRSTIKAIQVTATQWAIAIGTDYWQFQAGGTAPHPIKGEVRFFWERESRYWRPGHNIIHHPGNPPVHFVDMARYFVRTYYMQAARRHFA